MDLFIMLILYLHVHLECNNILLSLAINSIISVTLRSVSIFFFYYLMGHNFLLFKIPSNISLEY